MKRFIIFLITVLFLTLFIGNDALAGDRCFLQRSHSITKDELIYYIGTWQKGMPYDTRAKIASGIIKFSDTYRIDELFVTAMIARESGFYPRAVNRGSGARGLGQLMPVHKVRGGDYFAIEANLETSVRHLAYLLSVFHRQDLALAAYNAGENRVKRAGYIIPRTRNDETRIYVANIMNRYYFLLSKYGR